MTINAADFFAAEWQYATVISLSRSFIGPDGRLGDLRRLSEIAEFYKLTLETRNDLEVLESAYLVWYTINDRGESRWDKVGCRNYTVSGYVDDLVHHRPILEANKEHRKRITEIEGLMESIGRGLNSDVVVITAVDTGLKRRVIVDGCKRSVSLAMLAKQKKAEFSRILGSEHAITVLETASPSARCLYPADFLGLCGP